MSAAERVDLKKSCAHAIKSMITENETSRRRRERGDQKMKLNAYKSREVADGRKNGWSGNRGAIMETRQNLRN
jgi:hypothetical protein